MIFHRFDAYRQLFGNLLVGVAFGDLHHEYVLPDGRKIFGDCIEVIGGFVFGVGRTAHCSFFLPFNFDAVLVFAFNALPAEVIDVNGTGDGEELCVKGPGIGQCMPGLPEFDKSLLGKVFRHFIGAGAFEEVMKQFSVVLVVHGLKSYLIAFFYFSNWGQSLHCLEGRNSGAKLTKWIIWDYYLCVKDSARRATGNLGNNLKMDASTTGFIT